MYPLGQLYQFHQSTNFIISLTGYNLTSHVTLNELNLYRGMVFIISLTLVTYQVNRTLVYYTPEHFGETTLGDAEDRVDRSGLLIWYSGWLDWLSKWLVIVGRDWQSGGRDWAAVWLPGIYHQGYMDGQERRSLTLVDPVDCMADIRFRFEWKVLNLIECCEWVWWKVTSVVNYYKCGIITVACVELWSRVT